MDLTIVEAACDDFGLFRQRIAAAILHKKEETKL
jgi:hypothetical protein